MKKISSLIHYTSLVNGLSILINKKIYFNAIENSNDALETQKAVELNETNKHYVFCCNNNYFSSLMWLAYSKNQAGCAIRFSFKNNRNPNELFVDKKIASFLVKYISKKDFLNISKDDFGFKKFKNFKNETEYRYLITILNNEYKEKYIPRDLNFECLNRITIYCTNRYLEFVKKIAQGFNKIYGSGFFVVKVMDLLI